MADTIPDLWPDNVGTTELVPPVTILRQQAALLGTKTQNLVEANVKTMRIPDGLLRHEFRLVAPALDHYSYGLFAVTHGAVDVYPVTVLFGDGKSVCGDGDKLREELRRVLSSERTSDVIASLIAQSKG